MKKTILILILFGFLTFPVLSLAQNNGIVQRAPKVSVVKVLERIASALLTLLMLGAIIAFVIAGFYFVTAQGDPEKIKTAKTFVIWALIGIAVALSAKTLVGFVKSVVIGTK